MIKKQTLNHFLHNTHRRTFETPPPPLIITPSCPIEEGGSSQFLPCVDPVLCLWKNKKGHSSWKFTNTIFPLMAVVSVYLPAPLTLSTELFRWRVLFTHIYVPVRRKNTITEHNSSRLRVNVVKDTKTKSHLKPIQQRTLLWAGKEEA